MSISYGMGNLVVLGAWVAGLAFALADAISVPQMVAITSLMTLVAGPFQIISERYSDIVGGKAIAKDLLSFVDGEPNRADYKSDVAELRTLELRGACYKRGGNDILQNVDFAVSRGETVAIVGESGSGKSTVLRLLAGVIDADNGEVCVNGVPLVGSHGLTHREITLITQETMLFSAAIRDNVSLFAEKDDSEVLSAINAANMTQWFSANGCDLTREISKSDVNLSGGELLRLDFARALLENGQVILLDEPTSGLDASNTQIIADKIFGLRDKIVVVATHDLREEFLRRFDRVYVVNQGRIDVGRA